MKVDNELRIQISQEDKENFVRPAADPTFRSVAEVYGKKSIGIVLTGLGKDGTNGMETIKNAGGKILVQNPDTSTAPFMPRAAIKNIPEVNQLDLENIPSEISDLTKELDKI